MQISILICQCIFRPQSLNLHSSTTRNTQSKTICCFALSISKTDQNGRLRIDVLMMLSSNRHQFVTLMFTSYYTVGGLCKYAYAILDLEV